MHPYMVLACWQELDTKVQGLHEQRMKQLSLERECSRLRQEVDRLAVLQPLLEGQHCVHTCHSHTCSTHHSHLSDAPCDTQQPLSDMQSSGSQTRQHSAHFLSQRGLTSS